MERCGKPRRLRGSRVRSLGRWVLGGTARCQKQRKGRSLNVRSRYQLLVKVMCAIVLGGCKSFSGSFGPLRSSTLEKLSPEKLYPGRRTAPRCAIYLMSDLAMLPLWREGAPVVPDIPTFPLAAAAQGPQEQGTQLGHHPEISCRRKQKTSGASGLVSRSACCLLVSTWCREIFPEVTKLRK